MQVDNKAIVARLFSEVINEGRFDAADELASEDVVFRGRGGKAAVSGLDSFKRVVSKLREAFPNLKFTIDDQIAEGDRVATRFTVTGTHLGDYFGTAPTGRSVTYSAVDIFRIADGKIEEVWSLSDQLHLLEQLGVVSRT